MILDEIVKSTEKRVAKAKQTVPLEKMKQIALEQPNEQSFPFEKALTKKGMSFICEVKRASPSKGMLAENFDYLAIAHSYEQSGANALSVLTEPEFFKGKNTYLTEIKQAVNLPILRKDFIVDEYQIYEAKTIGADAVLLIVSILDDEQLRHYHKLARSLGLSSLVEVHSQEELKRALELNPQIIGVNNRDLKTFTVDLKNSVDLRSQVPKDILFIAESGIKTRKDVSVLVEGSVDGILIGETMMLAKDKKARLSELRGESA
ncbi:indole-3-glycerol phosphate synthase TrpC [Carnobacterium sp.]|uniref:indole-3-glycerol phosphate synthase TrpC n=1 Tax=Carnobacterium sp. TaxID=48221 RepID=UPI00388E41A4